MLIHFYVFNDTIGCQQCLLSVSDGSISIQITSHTLGGGPIRIQNITQAKQQGMLR